MLREVKIDRWPNPFIEHRADPHILRHGQRWYFTASVPDYDSLELRCADTLLGLRDAEPVTVWRKPDSGPCSQLIWAPELHRVDDLWILYFSAAPSREEIEGLCQHRMFALVCEGNDPMTGIWQECHQIATPMDTFSLDATYCSHQGRHWYIWAQQNPEVAGNTCLYLAELSNPWTIKGMPLMLSRPEFDWEKKGGDGVNGVNEAPTTILHGNRLFVAYSAAATDENYGMGLLWTDKEADPLQLDNWVKLNHAVLSTDEENEQYGPGYSCFTTDGQGRDVLIYHSRNHTGISEGPEHFRHTRLKYFHWDKDGMPDFGEPPPENH